MARNDILWMARQADREWDCDRNMVEWLEHFAGLVTEMEREACAKLVEADGLARGKAGLVFIKAAARIRARGEE